MTVWPIYTGTGVPHQGIDLLPAPPNWRTFGGGPVLPAPEPHDPGASRKLGARAAPEGDARTPDPEEVQMVNAALFLRRPLLVTGRPGTGKSTLASLIAKELSLGPVLRWPITSRSTLLEGLYHYDAIGRLRDENLRRLRHDVTTTAQPSGGALAASDAERPASPVDDIGRHLRLGPLGTALLPHARPRVLLIDEIDKCDVDLPNDLLNVFEEGEFVIDELARLPRDAGPVSVMTADRNGHAAVEEGHVQCAAFPVIVLTSNGERDFPTAFLRRCLRLDLRPPGPEQIAAIISAQLGPEAVPAAEQHVQTFLARRDRSEVTTDQLLNAVYLATSGSRHEDRTPEEVASLDEVVDAVMRPLTGPR